MNVGRYVGPWFIPEPGIEVRINGGAWSAARPVYVGPDDKVEFRQPPLNDVTTVPLFPEVGQLDEKS
jgi:hypothetical protein